MIWFEVEKKLLEHIRDYEKEQKDILICLKQKEVTDGYKVAQNLRVRYETIEGHLTLLRKRLRISREVRENEVSLDDVVAISNHVR